MTHRLATDLFLLMLNLAQMRDAGRVMQLFLDAINNSWEGLELAYQPQDEACPDETTLTVGTARRQFGCLRVVSLPAEDSQEALSLTQNAVGMLGVILENLWQAEQLQKRVDHMDRMAVGHSQEMAQRDQRLRDERSQRLQAEEALSLSEERLRLALEATQDGLWDWDVATDMVYWDHRCFAMLGYEPYEFPVSSQTWLDLMHPDDRQPCQEALARHLADDGQPFAVEFRLRTNNGQWMWIKGRGRVAERDAQGAPVRMVGTHLDIDQRRRVQDALRQSEEKFSKAFKASPVWVAVTTLDEGRFLEVNDTFSEITGISRQDAMGKTSQDLGFWLSLDDRQRAMDALSQEGRLYQLEMPMRFQGGQVRTMLWSAEPIEYDGQECLLNVLYDITERHQAQRELADSRRRLAQIIDFLPDAIFVIDTAGRVIAWNQAMHQLSGQAAEDILGHNGHAHAVPFFGEPRPMLADLVMTPEPSQVARYYRTVVQDGERVTAESELADFRGRGAAWLYHAASRLYDAQGQVVGAVEIVRDITKRRQREKALRASEARLRTIFQAAENVAFIITDTAQPQPRIIEFSPGAEKIFGHTRQEALRRPVAMLHAPEFAELWPQMREILEQDHKGYKTELTMTRRSGKAFPVLFSAFPLRGESQELYGFLQVAIDITEQRSLERQLRQAQKMDALGTLAGGVAHDFNNILGAIMGYSELALDAAHGGRDANREIQQVIRAAERARSLVEQILTFSRKVEGDLKPLNLNREIIRTVEVLEHILPKMVDLQTRLQPELQLIQGDGNQLEQVLINLATNASDAMPEGGQLTFATRDLDLDEEFCSLHPGMNPGPHVLLEVTDTGVGMPAAVREQIFDPFFTTKEPGKGTGLGLSTVFGIVKNHGGQVLCYSQPGQGTTFRIYLPVLSQEPSQAPAAPPVDAAVRGGTETIMLVDDETDLRQLGSNILSRVGYKVLTASSGEEALEIYSNHSDEIDVVVLDLGMPGMGGQRCLAELLAIDPLLRVMIASGYAYDQRIKQILSQGAKGFLAKPFRRNDLLRSIRQVLDRPASAGG